MPNICTVRHVIFLSTYTNGFYKIDMRKLLLTLAVVLISSASMMQAQRDQFFSQDRKSTFNMPEFGIGLDLQSGVGVCPEKYMGDSIFLSVAQDTYYFVNFRMSRSENSPYRVKFKLKGKPDNHYMTLCVMPRFIDNVDLYRSTWEHLATKHEDENYESLPSIKSKIGESVSLHRVVYKEDYHYFVTDDWVCVFIVPEADREKDRKEYLKIIKSLSKRTNQTELTKYRNKVNSGYFDPREVKDIDSRYTFEKRVGKVDKSSEMQFDIFNMAFKLPAKSYYSLDSRYVKEQADGSLSVGIYDIDMYEKQNYYWSFFKLPTTRVNFRVLPVKQDKSYSFGYKYTYDKEFKLNLDGVTAIAHAEGSDKFVSLTIKAVVDTTLYEWAFWRTTKANISEIDDFVASIRFPGVENKGKVQTNEKPISSVVKLKAVEKIEFGKAKIAKPIYEKGFACEMPDARLQVFMPGSMSDYLIRPDENFEKKSSRYCLLKDTPQPLHLGWYGITSGSLCFVLDASEFDNLTDVLTDYHTAFNSSDYYRETQIDITNINGRDWGVVTTKDKDGNYNRLLLYVTPELTYTIRIDRQKSMESVESLSGVVYNVDFSD